MQPARRILFTLPAGTERYIELNALYNPRFPEAVKVILAFYVKRLKLYRTYEKD